MSLASFRRGILGRFVVLVRETRTEIAVVEGFLVWWNCFLESWVSEESSDRCLSLEVGSCFRSDGGWLELLCT